MEVVLPGKLLHTLLTPRTLVRSVQYLTRGSEDTRIPLATPR